MEDKDKKQEENIEELGNEEKVNTFRELIVGPDKREIEGQLQGMKELFATMLVENKKDYDNQVNDMRSLFVNVLEENRRVFQMQLQDLYKNLPSLINNSLREQQEDGFIFKSGGGITAQSKALEEYEEMIRKVYLPFQLNESLVECL